MPLTLYLDNVKFGAGEVPTPPGQPAAKMLEFLDEQSGIRVQVPLLEQSAQQLAAMLTGRNIAVPNGAIPEDLLRRGPDAQKPPQRPR